MGILNDSGIKKIDIDLVKFFFDAQSSNLETLEELGTGMFSTQQKLEELKNRLLGFIQAQKSQNSIFYIFLDEERIQNLKIVVSSVIGETDEFTKEYAIVLQRDLIDLEAREINLKAMQLSVSGKLLTLIQI